ncbi:nitrate reductase [Citrobacter rodentium]|uniref:Nitrate reductase n=1 Tax=Citrobacter rodentium (strain ICC168) TaxID=637910 RepID=D2TL93_CITRI|nr:nitrate reductase [Citrobacter rodentium]KIQ49340.1 nitrate reductase [Citrobacter rodentium]UHO29781.1 nitrate reductase [Citrobacter rodentium NBRC 105723 = DSM 16636]CBG88542.1 nitrate reductase [Citrobacter rodentium ICC168]HAT8012681.1 nitrate reductase [Citrobacter rodentium NBRC 105723 = DSM 16636]HAT8016689.1 nitrate reductase [Citrobacter rodentium]
MSETRTTCPYCGVGCGVIAGVSEKGITIKGDPQHPANAGRLCVKGAALAETTALTGRLLHPQVDGERVSWRQALETAGQRLKTIIDHHGPNAVAFYASGQLLTEDYYAANKLMKGFIGAANIDTNSRLCMSSAVTGYKRAFGEDVVPCSYEDVEQSDLVILVGSNAAWTHPVLYQRLAQAKAVRPAMRVVVIDPRRTATCDIADLHLPLAPGSDAGLFVGLLNAIHQSGLTKSDFAGAPEALALAEAWSPARVAQFCGLEPQAVTAFYDWFISAPTAITLYCMGINQSASGSDKCSAIINAHLASGKFDRAGCGPFSLTGQPNAMGGREVGGLATQLAAHMNFEPDDLSRVARFWGTERLAQTPGLMAVDLFAAIAAGEVKAVWIMGTNPAVSLPDSHAVSQALAACPLVIVSEVVASTDTSRFAHIRFPALAWGEKEGTVTNSERRISRQRAFLPAPGEARADWWIIAQMAKRLGFAAAFDWPDAWAVFREHAALSGFENNGERAFDISALADLSREQWQAMTPVRWPLSRTPDAPQRWRRLRMAPVAPQGMKAQCDALYPLVLNSGRIRDQWHTMTRTGNVPRLMQHISEPTVELAPGDAERLQLTDGGLCRIHSVRGVMVARVAILPGQRPGSAFAPMHWNDRFARQGRVNALVAAVCDPHSGQPESKQTAVRITPWQPRWQGELFSREALSLPPFVHGWRKAAPCGQRYVLAADRLPADWLENHCIAEGWQVQRAATPQSLHLLAWHNGELMLGLWSGAARPEVDEALIIQAFRAPPESAQGRQALLRGKAGSERADPGAIVCSCFSVGEKAIAQAIAGGCDSVSALGKTLRCGTNCGSCIPELQALLNQTLPCRN